MTSAREFVIRSSKIKGLSLIKPTKRATGILAVDYSVKPARVIVDARTWPEARTQLIDHYKPKK